MKPDAIILRLWAALVLVLVGATGCESTDGGASSGGSVYYGAGFYDPWYYGDYHDDVDIIVTPPERPEPPPRPTHPIAPPPPMPAPRPMPMPSIPSMPRPSVRR